VLRRHPWVLSGSVASVRGSPEAGAEVLILDERGRTLGIGDYDPESQIRVRMLAFGAEPLPPDEAWLEQRIASALEWRRSHALLQGTDALRLIHAEADGLPGLTVDRYADWLSIKLGTPGMRRRAPLVARLLEKYSGAKGAWLRGDDAPGGARSLFGEVPDQPVEIDERGRRYLVNIKQGQKTGFYLDQRDARDLFASLANGARVLDLFAYTGGFSVAAAQGGAAEVVAVESSARARALLASNAPNAEIRGEDVGEYLRSSGDRFDLIAADPPPYARRKRDVEHACRAYKDLLLHALARANPGAHVLCFSCSHHVGGELFRKVVTGAAADAQVEIQFLSALAAPPDHPVSALHPQGEYLSGWLLRVC
jgi:23S rRNA (cytosine1962-C5)-methyltransferase